ncbi:hypothetical protein A5724_04635 [Mycobacterium sp. ACS1612]|uniref:DUF4097 family beta strand repeat-containing protein n=1 Tax=Mycobacterium sp. ACS1612 TaxID=1834117 RepID=UPI000801288E|nr:DUF4097 family beta strand repeat-containing protein [Mycobacterium sp. ACS1612]OBF41801.1 hypothetical protein A5724_04635 [Mycobacterium sp. ACS1612]
MTTFAPPPPAPTSAPPPLSPGWRTAFRFVLIAGAVVLVVGALASLGTVAWGISSFRVITDSKPLPAGMRSVVVDTGDTPVAIRITTDRDAREPRADLRMVNSTRAGAHPLAVKAEGGDTRIMISGESTPFLDWGRAGEMTLLLPPELARRLSVTTRQDNGIVFAQAGIDQLIAHTDNGRVILGGSARRIEVDTDNGDVVSRDPISVSESFTATADNGDVKVDFAEAPPRTIDITSDNGDVVIALPARGPYAVNASTDNGDTVVRVPQATDREKAAAVITARSENGDVIIEDSR